MSTENNPAIVDEYPKYIVRKTTLNFESQAHIPWCLWRKGEDGQRFVLLGYYGSQSAAETAMFIDRDKFSKQR